MQGIRFKAGKLIQRVDIPPLRRAGFPFNLLKQAHETSCMHPGTVE